MFRQQLPRCPRDGATLIPFTRDPLVGTVLHERYSIIECIAEGAMGRVYRAHHETLQRPLAIKVLFGDLAADESMQARFHAEATAAASMNHRNIAAITDFGETDRGLLYLAMELVEGCSLAHITGELEVARLADLLTQICAGLDHAHRRGLVHRDLKADNILLARDGDDEVIKIVDFGIAIAAEPDSGARFTRDGLVVGTPDVMSPEQLAGATIDHRADLFALGVVAYELIAGVVPFDGSSMDVARQNMSTPAPPIRDRSPGSRVEPAFEAIAMRLMEKRPEDRFQSAKEVARAVEIALAAAQGRPAPAARPFGSDELVITGTEPTLALPKRSRRAGAALAGLLLAAAVAVVAIGFTRRELPADGPAPMMDRAPKAVEISAPDAPDSIESIESIDAAPPTAVTSADAAAVRAPAPPRKRARRRAPEIRNEPAPVQAQPPEEDVYESRY